MTDDHELAYANRQQLLARLRMTEARLQRVEAALAAYADEDNWYWHECDAHSGHVWDPSTGDTDPITRARVALAAQEAADADGA